MRITIEAEPKEMAALVLAVQERQESGKSDHERDYDAGDAPHILVEAMMRAFQEKTTHPVSGHRSFFKDGRLHMGSIT